MNMIGMFVLVMLVGVFGLMAVAALFLKDKPEVRQEFPPEEKKKD